MKDYPLHFHLELENLEKENLEKENLATDNLAPGQFGTNIIKGAIWH